MSWVGVEEIAAHIGVSPHSVRKWCQQGLIPHGRAGRRLVFEVISVESWMRDRGSAGSLCDSTSEERRSEAEAQQVSDAIWAGEGAAS